MINRVYVEKKKGFDVRAGKLMSEFDEVLGIKAKVRAFIRYDADTDREEFLRAVKQVFSEPPVDEAYLDKLPEIEGRKLCVSLLPGQYDQRADSAAQCFQMLTLSEKPIVKCADVYVIEGVDDEQFARIRKYLINPVEAREVSDEPFATLNDEAVSAAEERVAEGFSGFTDLEAEEFYKQNSFAFSLADMLFIRDYFRETGRDPYYAELKVLDTYWSDHCRHTTFSTELTDVDINSDIPEIEETYDEYLRLFDKHHAGKNKCKCLMDIATMGARELKSRGLLKLLDESKEINACSIKVPVTVNGKKEEWLVMFKNETHNHPTEIEPFGGAATCLGGAIRDPLSGRVYVYHAMRITGAGDITAPFSETKAGKLPQRVISRTAAAGFSSYGNQIGLATGIVKEFYHPGYVAKRLETGFVVGAAPAANVIRKEPEAGDLVFLIGGDTGRDGCGGATGSSKAHNLSSLDTCGAEVQKGNPLTERKLQRLFRNHEFTSLIKRCNDFGAGGVSVAIGELSEGMNIALDAVPKKYRGLSGTELAISESQERMAVVVDASAANKLKELCAAENVKATRVAEITDDGVMRMFFNGKEIVSLPRSFLDTNGVRQTATAVIADKNAANYGALTGKRKELFAEKRYGELTKELMSDHNVCSQKGLGEIFDSTIGAGTVLMPFGGKRQLTPALAMAAKLPVLGETDAATVAAYGFDPYLSEQSPFTGAVYAVLVSYIKAVASGADASTVYLTLQEFFEKLRTEPSRWGKPLSAILGALYAQLGLKAAAIGGKDSMSGSFEDIDVPPTLISFALGMARADKITDNVARREGAVYRFRIPRTDSGMPDFNAVKKFLAELRRRGDKGEIDFVNVAETGGTVCALVKSLLGCGRGFKFAFTDESLFGSLPGDVIYGGERIAGCELLGIVIEEHTVYFDGDKIALSELEKAFTSPLESVYPTTAKASGKIVPCDYYGGVKIRRSAKVAKPRVFMPIFPGTNCEIDTMRRFVKAGAEVDMFVIKNLTKADMDESVAEIKRRVDKSNIIMFSGGFSGGDEPDGSGKFIAATFISPYIAEAVKNLLYKRDGLILGICNGFQALIKLGLLPYGEISPLQKDSPTLTYNNINRHVSTIVKVRVASNLSPWFAQVKTGEIYNVAVSHGEGKFTASDAHLRRMIEAGQIATQYADTRGFVTMESPFNPNGSVNAVEGITSPDGRVLGKMGHSERIGKSIIKNIDDAPFDMKIFESGVKYFG